MRLTRILTSGKNNGLYVSQRLFFVLHHGLHLSPCKTKKDTSMNKLMSLVPYITLGRLIKLISSSSDNDSKDIFEFTGLLSWIMGYLGNYPLAMWAKNQFKTSFKPFTLTLKMIL